MLEKLCKWSPYFSNMWNVQPCVCGINSVGCVTSAFGRSLCPGERPHHWGCFFFPFDLVPKYQMKSLDVHGPNWVDRTQPPPSCRACPWEAGKAKTVTHLVSGGYTSASTARGHAYAHACLNGAKRFWWIYLASRRNVCGVYVGLCVCLYVFVWACMCGGWSDGGWKM